MANNKHSTAEALKGKTVVDPQAYFRKLKDTLYEMDQAGLYDRNNKLDNQFFSAKEAELKAMEELLYKMVGDMVGDPNADKHRYSVELLVVKQQGVR